MPGKQETLEHEVSYLKNDIVNLKKENAELRNELNRKIDFCIANLKMIVKRQESALVNKYKCKKCEGYGTVYISPISDMGQDNKCSECHGEGFIWV